MLSMCKRKCVTVSHGLKGRDTCWYVLGRWLCAHRRKSSGLEQAPALILCTRAPPSSYCACMRARSMIAASVAHRKR